MTLLLTALLCICISCMAFSQDYTPFPLENGVWSELYQVVVYPDPDDPDYIETDSTTIRYVINGDTLVNGIVYRKLYETTDSLFDIDSPNTFYKGALREDAKRIYHRFSNSPGGERLLYNFNMQPGDTLTQRATDTGEPFWVVLTSIDSITFLDGSVRNKFNFTALDSLGSYFGTWPSWVEGMGNLLGLFYQVPIGPQGDHQQLMCFHKGDTLLYQAPDFDYCFYEKIFVSSKEVARLGGISMYPNPIASHLNIRFTSQIKYPVSLSILSLRGDLVYTKKLLLPKSEHTLSIKGILHTPGIYILSIANEEGYFHEKFVRLD